MSGTESTDGPAIESAASMLRRGLASVHEVPVVVEHEAPPVAPTPTPSLPALPDRPVNPAAIAVIDELFEAAGLAAVGSPRELGVRLHDGAFYAFGPGQSLVIGRSPGEGRHSLALAELSRTHLRIERRPDGLWAFDLGATNGTQVHRGVVHPLRADVPFCLEAGDRILTAGDVVIGVVEESSP